MNKSLTKFVQLRTVTLRVGLIALGIGLLFVLFSFGGGTREVCAPDIFNGGETCEQVPNLPNYGTLGFGGFLALVGTLSLNLWVISLFLIQTATSIVEGMGGNIKYEIVKKTQDEAPKA